MKWREQSPSGHNKGRIIPLLGWRLVVQRNPGESEPHSKLHHDHWKGRDTAHLGPSCEEPNCHLLVSSVHCGEARTSLKNWNSWADRKNMSRISAILQLAHSKCPLLFHRTPGLQTDRVWVYPILFSIEKMVPMQYTLFLQDNGCSLMLEIIPFEIQ